MYRSLGSTTYLDSIDRQYRSRVGPCPSSFPCSWASLWTLRLSSMVSAGPDPCQLGPISPMAWTRTHLLRFGLYQPIMDYRSTRRRRLIWKCRYCYGVCFVHILIHQIVHVAPFSAAVGLDQLEVRVAVCLGSHDACIPTAVGDDSRGMSLRQYTSSDRSAGMRRRGCDVRHARLDRWLEQTFSTRP